MEYIFIALSLPPCRLREAGLGSASRGDLRRTGIDICSWVHCRRVPKPCTGLVQETAGKSSGYVAQSP